MRGTAASLGNSKKGIVIFETLKEYENIVLTSKKYIRFNEGDIQEYEKKFILLQNNKILDNGIKYSDDAWVGMGSQFNITIDFSQYEYNKGIYLSLKSFAVIQLFDKRITIEIVSEKIRRLIKLLHITQMCSKDKLEEFKDYIENKEAESTTRAVVANIKFNFLEYVYFNPVNNFEDYLEVLYKIKAIDDKQRVRKIPNYKSILRFNELLNRFFSDTNIKKELKEKFKIIELWWKITTIIPLRPYEFIQIEKNCCRYDEDTETYYITVPRCKIKPNPKSKIRVVPIKTELRISKDVYYLIQDYMKLYRTKRQYLFTLEHYAKFQTREHVSMNNTKIKDRINYNHIKSRLKDFYDEVITGIYGYKTCYTNEEKKDDEITMLKLGDSRHISFCNMMLSGYSPLTIAQIGGHECLESQQHYVSHLDTFIDAHSYLLTDSIAKRYVFERFRNLEFSRERAIVSLSTDNFAKPRNVDGDFKGLCYSKDFPYQCVTDCCYCEHFTFSYQEADKETLRKYLSKDIEKLKREIELKKDFIKQCYKEAVKDFNKKELKYDIKKEQELKRTSRQVRNLMNQKSILEAYNKLNSEVII